MDRIFSPPLTAALMDPSTVGGLGPLPQEKPYNGPNGMVYPDGSFDSDGTFVPLQTQEPGKITVLTPHGPVEVTLEEYYAHFSDRPIHWQTLPWGLDQTLKPNPVRDYFHRDPTMANPPQFQTKKAHDAYWRGNGPDWVPPTVNLSTHHLVYRPDPNEEPWQTYRTIDYRYGRNDDDLWKLPIKVVRGLGLAQHVRQKF